MFRSMWKFLQYKSLLVIVFAFSLRAQSDNALFDHITIDDGLSHSLVHKLTQDSIGYIWIATQEGLNRFDGYSIKEYKRNSDKESLLDNWVSHVTTDNDGNVWYGTRAKGFGRFSVETSSFENYLEMLIQNFGQNASKIQDILITSDSVMWIATWGAGLLKFNPQKKSFLQFAHDPANKTSISENRVYTVFEDSKGTIWAGAHRTGLNKLDPVTNNFVNYRVVKGFENGLTNNFVVTIEEDYLGQIWIGTYGGGLYRFNKAAKYFDKLDQDNNINESLITKIFEDNERLLWICTDGGGIYKYQRREDSFINFKNIPTNRRSLNDNRVWSVMEDNSGILWFGTFSGGINIYNKNKNIFDHLYNIEGDSQTIVDNFVKSIFQDSRNNIWIGTNKGITVINHITKKMKHYTVANGLTHNRIRRIYEDNWGTIWLTSWGGGVMTFNPATQKFTSLLHDPDDKNSLADNYTKSVIQYSNHKYYIGSEVGLNEYDKERDKFTLYNHDENDSTSISNSQISVLFIDSFNNFWVGTQYGLNLFFPETGTFRRFVYNGSNKGINNYRVSEIFQDSNNRLWIGTYGRGLNLFDYETKTFTYITEEHGLSNNSIYEVLEDDTGNLWVSTNKGITSFNPDRMVFKAFTKQDGLQANEFNGGAALKTSDGKLYFGGINGINIFDPVAVQLNTNPPTVVITELKVNGMSREIDGLSSIPNRLVLDHDENFLNFTFAALDYTAPEMNRYKYKLIGLEDEWNDAGTMRFFTYTNLDPGNYTLHVIASNSDNVWNNDGLKFDIEITPPWWGTNIFRFSFLLLVIIFVIGGYRLRVNQIKRRQLFLEKIVNERTNDLLKSKELLQEAIDSKDKLFSIIAHDLKNPFLPLLGYSELLTYQYKQLNTKDISNAAQMIHQSARSIYSLLENLLDWARIQFNKFEYVPSNIKLHDLVDEVFELYKVIIKFKQIDLANDVDTQLIIHTDVDMLKTVLRNVISNSVKYCKEGDLITISSWNDSGYNYVKMSDTGSGIDKIKLKQLNSSSDSQAVNGSGDKGSGTGLGLMLVKELAQIMKGAVEIKSVPEQGTTILLKIPVNR